MMEAPVVVKEAGIQETKEAIIAAFELVKIVFPIVADGVDYTDIFSIAAKTVGNSEFKVIVEKAVVGKEKIVAEMENLSLPEIVELSMFTLNYLRLILSAKV